MSAPCSITNTHLLRSEVGRGVDEERLVPDVLLDLLPCFLAVPEALLRQRNLPVRNVDVSLDPVAAQRYVSYIGLAGRVGLTGARTVRSERCGLGTHGSWLMTHQAWRRPGRQDKSR